MDTIRNVVVLLLVITGILLTVNLIEDYSGKHLGIYLFTAPIIGLFIYLLYNKPKS
jgi:hypothetical protein